MPDDRDVNSCSQILGKWPPKFRGFGRRLRGKMRPQSWIFFLQIGLTESMTSGAEKNREIIPLTWKNSWKVAPEIRGFWPEIEGENEATVLDFFSADRSHGIHAF